jgi:hypothetical protein
MFAYTIVVSAVLQRREGVATSINGVRLVDLDNSNVRLGT